MKISKSFILYIHIIFVFFISQYVYADNNLSENIVIYENPKDINELKYK